MCSMLNFDEWFKFASKKVFRLIDDFTVFFDDENEEELEEHTNYKLIKMIQAIKMPTNTVLIGYVILNGAGDNIIHYDNFEYMDIEYHEEDQEV